MRFHLGGERVRGDRENEDVFNVCVLACSGVLPASIRFACLIARVPVGIMISKTFDGGAFGGAECRHDAGPEGSTDRRRGCETGVADSSISMLSEDLIHSMLHDSHAAIIANASGGMKLMGIYALFEVLCSTGEQWFPTSIALFSVAYCFRLSLASSVKKTVDVGKCK